VSDQPTPTTPAASTVNELEGFGGWLLLLAIGVCLAPLRLLAVLAWSWEGYLELARLPNGPISLVAESAITLVIFGLQIAVIVAMLGKRRSFPRLFTWLWVASIGSQIADTILMLWLFPQFSAAAFGPEFVRSIAGLVGLGLCVWYLRASKRVANTFTN